MLRIRDILIVILFLPFVLFIVSVCAIFIKVESPGPIIFRSERLGINKRLFSMYKLRTMTSDAPLVPTSNYLVTSYITSVGGFLRRYSLDELPQLLNVLKGEMSIIGPRPCLQSEKELVRIRQELGIFSALPGLTGLAQVKGGDYLTVKNKLRYEYFYSTHQCLLLDMEIALSTLSVITRVNKFRK